ncbi:unnamed protein product [Darwinula stevensoni]|uniref:Uncharacterized protein n=1 Tax=Darwinula stevensoni TaxID=69355 RepID=A0A7R8ZZZ6_9CRUS|nr:unnamed protein product [Darwinula stevensoni]CAG0884531.1 unnamed protein product [Darwinula stevensoni]
MKGDARVKITTQDTGKSLEVELNAKQKEVSATANEYLKLRPMILQMSCYARGDGAAICMQGDTVISAQATGPAEVKLQKEIMDKATIEVIFRTKSTGTGGNYVLLEKSVRDACETAILTTLHPRSAISIILLEMQNYGSLLSCCLNACCLALLDAGVPMNSTFAAVTIGISKDDDLIVDPDDTQEEECESLLTFAFESQNLELVASHADGQFTAETFIKCMKLACEISQEIFQEFRKCVKKQHIEIEKEGPT